MLKAHISLLGPCPCIILMARAINQQQELFNQSCKVQIMPLFMALKVDTHTRTHKHIHIRMKVISRNLAHYDQHAPGLKLDILHAFLN